MAFTYQGLRALELSADVADQLAPEFVAGLSSEESRARRLGDVGANAPQQWEWGAPGQTPHALLMLYAKPGKLEEWSRSVAARVSDAGFEILQRLHTSDLGGFEHFGFRDGISQPTIDWEQRKSLRGLQLEYSNLLALGEVLLGYPNEYGKYTNRPLLDPPSDPTDQLLPAPDDPRKKDFGRNGTYLVLRQLTQDVRGFWHFLDQQTGSDPTRRQRLAESMVGRTIDGEPLAQAARSAIAGISPADAGLNQFTFESDQLGVRCPFGAHIRRANPRNGDMPYGTTGVLGKLLRTLGFGQTSFRDDTVASTRFHRLLRRGRAYGPPVKPAEALAQPDAQGDQRGLHFICLNANISRQFEFVQNAWIMGAKFDALTEERDPILGNRAPMTGCPRSETFSLPQDGRVRSRIGNVPQFVTVRGGAYFFLPSLRALRYIASRRG